MFHAYCMEKINGRPIAPPVSLYDAEAAWRYVNQQKRIWPEVRITDGKRVVAQALEDRIVHPPEWRAIEMKDCSLL